MTDWQKFCQNFILALVIQDMLSIEEARKILWEEAEDMTDNQLQDFVNLLYSLCNIVWDKRDRNTGS